MNFSRYVFFKIGLGVVTIVAAYNRRNRDIRMNEFPMTPLAARNMNETRLPQVIDKLSDLPWQTAKDAQKEIPRKRKLP